MKAVNFDRVARLYRWAEYAAMGRSLERAREYFLPRLAGCKSVLALGDGDGRFLAKLMQQNAGMEAVAVDSSARMLRLLQKRCPRPLRVVCAEASNAVARAETDLVVTHFFFDCFSQREVDEIAMRLAGQVQSGTLWVVSDFGVPRARWLRLPAAIYVRGLYFAFRLLTGLRVTRLPDPQRALDRAGFARVERRELLAGLIYTELWVRR